MNNFENNEKKKQNGYKVYFGENVSVRHIKRLTVF